MAWSQAQKKYAQSELGKQARLRYQQSDKARETRKNYQLKRKAKLAEAKQSVVTEVKKPKVETKLKVENLA